MTSSIRMTTFSYVIGWDADKDRLLRDTRTVRFGVYVADSGATLYAATNGGLSVSTNGGTSWTNYTTAQGLASNSVKGVWVSGTKILAATSAGLSVSTNGGSSWTNYATSQGLAGSSGQAVFVSGSTIYVGTSGGLSIGQ